MQPDELKVPSPPARWTDAHAKEVGLPSPESVNYMMALASSLIGSALCTPDMMEFHGPPQMAAELNLTPREIVKANAMAKMLAGHELGIPAIESLKTIHIVKGRIFVSYEKLISIMHAKGYVTRWIKSDAEGAILHVWHPDGRLGEEGYTASFDMQKAKMIGLDKPSRSGEPSQYMKRPDVMFRARCVSDAYRVVGAGPTLYTYQEEEEIRASDTLKELPPAEPSAPATAISVPRKSQTAKTSKPEDAPAPEAAPPPSVAPTPQPSAEDSSKPKVTTETNENDAELMEATTRLAAVRERIPTPSNISQRYINAFVRAWYGIEDPKGTPKDRKMWLDVMPILEAIVSQDPKLLITPDHHSLVAQYKKHSAPPRWVEKATSCRWSEATIETARKVQKQYLLSDDEMYEWCFTESSKGGLELQTIADDKDVADFFDLAAATREAVRVLDISKQSNVSIHNIVTAMRENFKRGLHEVPETEIVTALERLEAVLKKQKEHAAEEPIEEEPAEDLPWF